MKKHLNSMQWITLSKGDQTRDICHYVVSQTHSLTREVAVIDKSTVYQERNKRQKTPGDNWNVIYYAL